MTAAYLVVYDGDPVDAAEFVRYYETVHVPLLWGFPGIRGVDTHVRSGDSGPFLVARLLFDSVDELRAAVDGEYRTVTRADMNDHLLPNFEGTVSHVVTEVSHWEPPPAE